MRTELSDLQQYAALQQRAQDRIGEDAAALEDMLVRVAGPTLQRIEEDCNTLDCVRQMLAQTPLKRLGQDARSLTKIAKKLSAPTVDRIAEDQAVLTGVAARASSHPFPLGGNVAPVGGSGANTGAMGQRKPGGPARPYPTPSSAPPMGYAGSPLAPAAGAGSHSPDTSQPTRAQVKGSWINGVYYPDFVDANYHPGPALPGVQSAAPVAGFVQQTADDEVLGMVSVPSLYQLSPSISAPPSPFSAPTPASTLAPTNGVSTFAPPTPESSLAPTTSATEPAPIAPPEPPALPAAPADDCSLCEAVQYLGKVLHAGLHAIAVTVHKCCPPKPDAQAQAQAVADSALAEMMDALQWIDPPDQPLTDAEGQGVFSNPAQQIEESQLQVVSGASGGATVSLPAPGINR